MRKTWNPATVIDQGETPRSYLIETGTGAHLQRNRIHLRPNNASNNLANNFKRQSMSIHRGKQLSKQPIEWQFDYTAPQIVPP